MKIKDTIQWQNVESSNIEAVAHDEEGLYVQFKNGSVYGYPNVPEQSFQELLAAESCGKYLNGTIKPNFQFERLQ